MPLFDSTFLAKLEYLSLVSRRVFRGALLAQRRTMQRGAGIEFADHREYTPGDDYRYLDWAVYARHGDLLLKRFQEEEDLHVYFLLDCSRSMAFGAPAKFDLARQLVAALAYIALADLDRVGVLAYSDRALADFPLTRGKSRILALLRWLEDLPTTGTDTDLARVAQSFVLRQQRRGLVIVISDLFDPRGFSGGLDLLRHRNYQPHVIQLHSPDEANPTFLGDLELCDAETDSRNRVTVTESHLRQYKRLFQDHQSAVARYCRQYQLGATQTVSTVPFDDLVLRMLRESGVAQ